MAKQSWAAVSLARRQAYQLNLSKILPNGTGDEGKRSSNKVFFIPAFLGEPNRAN